ncbi:oxygen-independent coproporphyrinogen III oxidase [Mariprofundus micogutta]|uniref:Heme chaperone HemW n=1 Tax=Mariprofundus micogutta TaxID=1921010 RepID=A0A1L8CQR0_9PROT|nr:radical SAM family heme chaperone HemW [Mariprofundus micogutta]GAV21262.1 oxygen-independent coproporphyrinogen III oxidase [Mariprofundus micogutta]
MLYVHIPYCVHKCHYCDFNSHEREKPDWSAYRNALLAELQHWAASPMFKGRRLSSIFFGGGTPSLAPPALITSVIKHADKLFGCETGIEITLEANPGTVDAGNFSAYRQAGVNRLSMGVQSLNTEELQWLERIHGSQEVFDAFQTARQAGFNNINLDLIYGLPDQSMQSWLESLNTAIHLAPEHLSCYQLTVEPHTRLAARHRQKPYSLPDDELALEMLFSTRKRLQKSGYHAYEISNFAKKERYCRHNDGYWLYHDYIGIGAGASGKWDQANDLGMTRYSNIRKPETYIESALQQGTAINSQETLDRNRAAAEAIWLGLRRSPGIDRKSFCNRFGFDAYEHFSAQLLPWQQQQMIDISENFIQLTEPGLPLADEIAASVL